MLLSVAGRKNALASKLVAPHFSKARFSVSAHCLGDRSSFAKPFSDVPRIPALPVLGSSWIYFPIVGRYNIRKLNEAALDMYKRYGPVVGERLPGRRVVVHLFSADDIRTLFQEEGRTPYRMGALPFKLYHTNRPDYFANAGILNAQGEVWRQVRATVQPCTMRPRTVQAYAESMGEIADDALKLIAADRDENGEVPDCYAIMQRWALESVMLVSLDKRLGLLENPLPPESDAARVKHWVRTLFSDMDKLVTHFPYYRYFSTPTMRRFERAGDYLVPHLFHMIREAAEATRSKGERSQNCTILQHLYYEQKMDFKEMFTFLHDFVVGGTDTTSGAATFSLYCLAMNSEAQEKAREEALSASRREIDGAEVDHPDHLPYLKACIKESLRFYPIIPGVNRKINHDVVMSGYRIPANASLVLERHDTVPVNTNFYARKKLVMP
ncbi:putative cytochrome P450 49a1 isoform X2 [Amblyomma americanum]